MTGLLAAHAVTVGGHILIDIFIADSRFLVLDSGLVQSLIKTEV